MGMGLGQAQSVGEGTKTGEMAKILGEQDAATGDLNTLPPSRWELFYPQSVVDSLQNTLRNGFRTPSHSGIDWGGLPGMG
jgi:hypothetical protein